MKWSCAMYSVLFVIISIFMRYCKSDDCICQQCDIDQLPDNCTTINGHIQIGLEAQMPPFEIIEYKLQNVSKIIGCVTIANSGFTSFQFLSNLEYIQYSQTGPAKTCSTYGNGFTIAKNSLLRRLYLDGLTQIIPNKNADYGLFITDNPSLCITEEELEIFLNTTKFYAPHISICNPSKNYCKLDSMNFFDSTNIPKGCQVLTDSLLLNGSHAGAGTQFQNRLNDIEEILGSIIIISTDIKTLIMPKLWRIYNFQPKLPVILLQKNPNLKRVEFDSLKSVPYFGNFPEVIYSYQNPKLTELSATTCSKLSSLGKISFDLSDSICEKHLVRNRTVPNLENTTILLTVQNISSSSTIRPTTAMTTISNLNPISTTTMKIIEGSIETSTNSINQIEKNKPPSNPDSKDDSNSCSYRLVYISFLFIYISKNIY